MKNDRRDFLMKVGGLTAAAVAGPALAARDAGVQVITLGEPRSSAAAAATAAVRSFAGGLTFGLELDGSFAGWLVDAAGGAAVGQVITEKLGSDGTQRKLIGGIKYEDITVNCGTGMSKAFYEWIQDTFDGAGKSVRRSGAVVATDFQARERLRLDFSRALLAEVGLPALDASSKDAAKMTIKFTPELTRHKMGSGAALKFEVAPHADKWHTSDFRLTISGLEDATSRAMKIDAMSFKQTVSTFTAGGSRDSGNLPAGLEFPNLAVTVPLVQSQSFYDWHESFVIQGDSGSAGERQGKLEILDRQQRPLFSLSFQQLGVFKVATDKEVTGEQFLRVKAEMYAERADFKFSIGWL
jgi:phage tail-like protein